MKGPVAPRGELPVSRFSETDPAARDPLQFLLVQADPEEAADTERMLDDVDGRPVRITSCNRLVTALELVKAHLPDLVLVDPRLPDARGCDAVARLSVCALGTPMIVLRHEEDSDPPGSPVHAPHVVDSLIVEQLNAEKLDQAIRHALQVKQLEERAIRAESEAERAHAQREAQSRLLARQAEQLVHSRNESTLATRAKTDFVARMSHEIRTPMNAILGMTDLALRTELSDSQRDYLGLIKTSADTLLTLINDLLDFSKIESGKLELEQVVFDLEKTIDDSIQPFIGLVERKGLTLRAMFDEGLPNRVIGDPSRLRQILANLIQNAIKFTDSGEICVRVGVEQSNGPTTRLTFEVADTGIGIPLERQETIFESFRQIDGSSTREQGGAGLGLTISSMLAEMMGSRIQVKSRPGQGSTFSFTLEFRLVDDVFGEQQPLAASSELLGRRAMVIQSDTGGRRNIVDSLARAGMLVEECVDATSATALLRRTAMHGRAIDVALIDSQVNGGDAFALASQILEDSQSKTRVLLMTLSGERGDASRCRELGLAGYLTRPIAESELFESLRAAVGSEPEDALITRHTLREARGSNVPAPVVDPRRQPAVDRSRLLTQMGGDLALLQELVPMFIEEKDRAMESLSRALLENDPEAMSRSAYKLKGTLDLLAADAAAAAAERLLRMGLDGGLDKPAPELEVLKEKIEELEAELRELAWSEEGMGQLTEDSRI